MQSSIDELSCPICLLPLFHAVISKCGHTLCHSCAENVKQCPTCRSFDLKYTPNFLIRSLSQSAFPEEYKTFLRSEDCKTFSGLRRQLADENQLQVVGIWGDEDFAFTCLRGLRVILQNKESLDIQSFRSSLPQDYSFILTGSERHWYNIYDMKFFKNIIILEFTIESKRHTLIVFCPKTRGKPFHKRKRIEIIQRS